MGWRLVFAVFAAVVVIDIVLSFWATAVAIVFFSFSLCVVVYHATSTNFQRALGLSAAMFDRCRTAFQADRGTTHTKVFELVPLENILCPLF